MNTDDDDVYITATMVLESHEEIENQVVAELIENTIKQSQSEESN